MVSITFRFKNEAPFAPAARAKDLASEVYAEFERHVQPKVFADFFGFESGEIVDGKARFLD